VVAITGSTGKTSTKDILAALCAPVARTVAAEASFNNELGVPLTVARLEEDTEICIVEVGMRGLGQIAQLSAIARPHIGVITSIGPVHLEVMGSQQNVAQAKAELIAALPAGGVAVVPADTPELEPHLRRDDVEIRRFATRDVLRVATSDDTTDAELDLGGRHVELTFNFAARHHVLNALAALHAYAALGLPLERAQEGATRVTFSRWRGDELPLPGDGLLINDAYNANPMSMRAALDHLVARAGSRRRVAVLGDMAELGRDAARYHREIGDHAAKSGVDVLLAVGPLAAGYLDGQTEIPVVRHVASIEEAVAALEEVVRPGDCVLVKASRAMGLETVAEALAGAAA
jgi:UDP-N-acetylmuramoyl-tripeptide--D-alanyl-D-alanine ligase